MYTKPFLTSLIVGSIVAGLHWALLSYQWALWDLSLVSVSGLVAGIFFIMAMIFRTAQQNYQNAGITIAKLRGVIFAMEDSNQAAHLTEASYKPSDFRQALITVTTKIKEYVVNEIKYLDVQKAIDNLTPESQTLRSQLTPPEKASFMRYLAEVRQHVSYLSFLKDLFFPQVGYLFLYFYIAVIVSLEFFSSAEIPMLSVLFIFSMTTVLVFFAELIRDLDHQFERSFASFVVDVVPLENTIKAIEARA